MPFMLWSGSFLVLSVGGSAVELASMIGAPIAPDIQSGLIALAVFVVASGTALVLVAPSTSPSGDEA